MAGLPPVTEEWFRARKEQLSAAAAAGAVAVPVQRTWLDPLTKKKFATENTYLAFVRSKKYLDLVRKSGEPAPEPVILTRQPQDAKETGPSGGAAAAAPPELEAMAAGALQAEAAEAAGLGGAPHQPGQAAPYGAQDSPTTSTATASALLPPADTASVNGAAPSAAAASRPAGFTLVAPSGGLPLRREVRTFRATVRAMRCPWLGWAGRPCALAGLVSAPNQCALARP